MYAARRTRVRPKQKHAGLHRRRRRQAAVQQLVAALFREYELAGHAGEHLERRPGRGDAAGRQAGARSEVQLEGLQRRRGAGGRFELHVVQTAGGVGEEGVVGCAGVDAAGVGGMVRIGFERVNDVHLGVTRVLRRYRRSRRGRRRRGRGCVSEGR